MKKEETTKKIIYFLQSKSYNTIINVTVIPVVTEDRIPARMAGIQSHVNTGMSRANCVPKSTLRIFGLDKELSSFPKVGFEPVTCFLSAE